MKKIFLIRHAKSSWGEHGLKDIERPLNERGRRDAPMMARFASKKWDPPGLVMISPAQRAVETAHFFKKSWWNETQTKIVPTLYEGSASSALEILANTDESISSVAAVFHNPTITLLSNILANANIENIPTCGVVYIGLESKTQNWENLSISSCKLLGFHSPKNLEID